MPIVSITTLYARKEDYRDYGKYECILTMVGGVADLVPGTFNLKSIYAVNAAGISPANLQIYTEYLADPMVHGNTVRIRTARWDGASLVVPYTGTAKIALTLWGE